MEDIGDYIYVVAIVIAALASLFKKRKKGEEAQTAGAPQFPDLSDVISEDHEGYDTHQGVFVGKEKSFQEILDEKFKATQTTFHVMKESSTTKEELDAYAKGKIDDLHTVEEPQWMDPIHLEDAHEAKRAFIYSEIFTRKYS